jgi:hypothetical protein
MKEDATETTLEKRRKEVQKIAIKRDQDLRSGREERAEEARRFNGPICSINSAHTLCHLYFPSEDGDYLRAKLPAFLKGTSNYYLKTWIEKRFSYISI